jgi:hypothetical protein
MEQFGFKEIFHQEGNETCSLSDIFWKSSSVSSSANIMSNSGSMTPSRSVLFDGPLKTNLGTGAEFFLAAAAAFFFFASC